MTTVNAKQTDSLFHSDPIVFTAVCLLLSVVTLLTAYVPSRRATPINPVEALRHA
jgi:ABC-type lipoprotein release transport system permease subunit